jgi:hypothetical protein
VLYPPDSRYGKRPLHFYVGGSPDWRADVFQVAEEFAPSAQLVPKLKNGRPKWIECDLPPEGWARLAAVLGLDSGSATSEFELLPPPVRSHFSPERDTPTTATRIASVAEVRHNHGVVTNKLAELLRLSGEVTGNDQRQDLLLLENGLVRVLFEVKSGSSLQSVYTAIGQLMYHGSVQEPAPMRVAVLPESISTEVVERLDRLDIRLVTFRLADGLPEFDGLDDVLSEAGGV